MAATVEEYQDVLKDEVYVDTDKLVEWALHGIPYAIQGTVWKYLLGTAMPEQLQETENARRLQELYDASQKNNLEFGQRVKFEIEQYRSNHPFFQNSLNRQMIHGIICMYLNTHDVPFAPHLVHVCGPLAFALPQPAPLSKMFSSVLERLAGAKALRERVGKFLALFDFFQHDLYQHFEEEELHTNEWLVNWLEGLLGKELPIECVLRLWDTYFAMDDGFDLHLYVCLAVLDKCKEDLEELEHHDLVQFLKNLPRLDMNQIIVNAENIKQISRELV
eukprot:m.57834 g.57834  ORF g.57834 m.57834 type:complete len:276 (+) comp13490_c0_seq1:2-829(+)